MNTQIRLWLLCLLVVLTGKVLAWEYESKPAIKEFTNTGSGTTSGPAINYNNEYLAGGTDVYKNGELKATLYNYQQSQGQLVLAFQLKKGNDGSFRNGNSGKVFIVNESDGSVFAQSFNITDDNTTKINFRVRYDNFTGSRSFSFYLITSDLVYKQYGGIIKVTCTSSENPPSITTLDANNITKNSAILHGMVKPNGSKTYYSFSYGTRKSSLSDVSSGSVAASKSYASVDYELTGLSPKTTYYFRLSGYNDVGSEDGDILSFTTEEEEEPDEPSDDMTMAQAAQYLQGKGVIDNGDPALSDDLLRQQLAKIAFRGVYSIKGRTVPTSVPSDNYPTVYSDLTDPSTYYYQAARALLYLEYGDGIAPFDRNRLEFAPTETIARIHVLKALMETFNIQPNSNLSNPFPDDNTVTNLKNNGNRGYGYIAQAAELGIILKPNGNKNTTFRANDPCTRGEAFIMLARIMKKIDNGDIKDPKPTNADYFEPLNTTLKTIALGLSLPMGNFQHYTKTSFALNGVVPLVFAHTYNSYNTTLPEVFYGVNDDGETYQPLGEGWSHNYHSFISVPSGLDGANTRLLVHWGGGSMDVYKSNGSKFVPESYGVYDELSLVGGKIIIKTKSQMEYHFSSQGGSNGGYIFYLVSVSDRNGNTLTINYETGENGMKRITSVSDGNRSLSFTYRSGTNLVSKVSDPLGRSIKFGYEYNDNTGRYQLSSFTDAKGQKTTYIYDDDSRASTSKLLTKIQLPKGNYIENEYDANRRLKNTESGVNGVPKTQTSVSVQASYSGSVVTKSEMKVTRGSETSSYNYEFNANNLVRKMTGEENLVVQAAYKDDAHPELPTSMRSNSTNISSVEYDDRGNMTSVTMKANDNSGTTLTTKMTYDTMNNLTSVTDPKGNKTTYSYDSKGNLTSVSAPEGVTTSRTVNSKGLSTEITDPMGVKLQFEYNTYGNLTKATIPALSLSSSATYDKASRLTSSTNALGHTSSFEYDNNDYLVRQTDPANHQISFDYDENDNLTSITNAKGGVTSMSYDNATDWLRSVEFAGATKRYDYNEDGTLKKYTKPDGTVLSYSYDDLGRVTSDGVNDYSYDNKLRLSSISGNGKTLSYTYDAFNRIIGTDYDGQSNSYTYDDNGNCTSINDTEYGYDKLNRMTSVKFNGKTITYTYRKDSQLSKVSYPNGMTTEYGYDAIGRLTSKKTKLSNGTVVACYSFELDKVGNITKQTTTEPYDGISLANEDISYSYNSGNRITKAGDISFSFDENGNTTKRGSEQYQWDEYDRLTRAGSTNITYDPLGLIASYDDITFTINPLGIGNVLSDSKSGAKYIYGNGLEARVKNGKVSYYVTDVRGSVIAIVDENGNITHKYQYDEYGKVTQKEEADYNPFQYVGKYGVMYLTDHQYYMRARHYDPTIGRFLSEDPIWSTNLYPYADNNPIMRIDPEGKSYDPIYEDPYSEYNKRLYVGELPEYYIEYEGAKVLNYAIVIKGNNGENIQKKVTYYEYREWREKQGIHVVTLPDNKKTEPVKNTQGSESPVATKQVPSSSNTSNIHYGIDFGNLNTNSIRGISPLGDAEMNWFDAQPDEVKDILANFLLNSVGISASGFRNTVSTAKRTIGM